MDLGPAYLCSQLDPLQYSIIAKKKKSLEIFVFSYLEYHVYIYICLISFILSSFFLLPFAFVYPYLDHFLVYLGLPAVSFIHSLFFPFLLSIKILATAKYSYEDAHLSFYKVLQLKIHVHISDSSACFKRK